MIVIKDKDNMDSLLVKQFSFNENSVRLSVVPILLCLILSSLAIMYPNISEYVMIIQSILIGGLFLVKCKNVPLGALGYLIAIGYTLLAAIINKSGMGTFVAYFQLMFILLINKYIIVLTRKESNLTNIVFSLSLCIVILFYSKKVGIYYCALNGSNMLNPNNYATILLALGMTLFVIIDKIRCLSNGIKYVLFIIVIAVFLLAINATDARTSIGAWIIFVTLYACGNVKLIRRQLDKNKSRQILLILTIILCVVFIFVYLLLYEVLGEIEILGKSLFTGREKIWSEALTLYKNNILFGFTNKYVFDGKWLNPHNGFLAMMCYLSFVALIAFAILIVKSIGTKKDESINVTKLFAIIAILFISVFENQLLDNLYSFLMFPFLLNKTRRVQL